MTTLTTRATKGTELTHNQLDANFSRNAQAKVGNYTVAEGDNNDTIECAGTFTVTLPDAAAIVAASDTGDFEVTLKCISGTITVARTTGTDTIDGTAADITLLAGDAVVLKVNQAGNGYNICNTQNEYLNITNGTGAASKAVVLSSASSFTSPGTGTWLFSSGSTVNVAGTLQIGGVSVTSTAAEINYLDIAALGTGAASKAVVLDASSNYTTPGAGTWTWSASSTANFAGTFQIGGVSVTSTAAELNILDGVTSTAAELNILDGVTASAAEINYNDITTLGTAQASKVLTLDASSNLNGTVTAATITTLASTTINLRSTPVYGLVVLDTPVLLVNNSGTTGAWTLVDMSVTYAAAATAGATKAILSIYSSSGLLSGTSIYSYVYCRKTGSALAANGATLKLSHRQQITTAAAITTYSNSSAIVNLDGNSDFDWYHDDNSGNLGVGVTIYLVGYYV